jgi:hypothetical protein
VVSFEPEYPLHKRQGKDTQKEYVKKLFKALEKELMSRRMAATELGFTDQTFTVTQYIYDWIKEEKAQVIIRIKCSRSGRWVQKVDYKFEVVYRCYAITNTI